MEFKRIGKTNNVFEITINDFKILISYDSIIGVLDNKNYQILLNKNVDKVRSRTTSKHINLFLNQWNFSKEINKNWINEKDFKILINMIKRNDYKGFNKKCLKLKE